MEESRGTGLRASGVADTSGGGGEPLVLSLGQHSPSESRQAAQLTAGRRNLETSKEETIRDEAQQRHKELKLPGGCGAAAPRQGLAAAPCTLWAAREGGRAGGASPQRLPGRGCPACGGFGGFLQELSPRAGLNKPVKLLVISTKKIETLK